MVRTASADQTANAKKANALAAPTSNYAKRVANVDLSANVKLAASVSAAPAARHAKRVANVELSANAKEVASAARNEH